MICFFCNTVLLASFTVLCCVCSFADCRDMWSPDANSQRNIRCQHPFQAWQTPALRRHPDADLLTEIGARGIEPLVLEDATPEQLIARLARLQGRELSVLQSLLANQPAVATRPATPKRPAEGGGGASNKQQRTVA